MAGELFVVPNRLINDNNFISVDLLRGQQRPISGSHLATIIAMNDVKPLQSFRFVCGDVDAWNARNERVANTLNRIKRQKMLELRSIRTVCLRRFRHKTYLLSASILGVGRGRGGRGRRCRLPTGLRLRTSPSIDVTARIVRPCPGRVRRDPIKTFGISALRASDAIKFSQRRIIIEQRLEVSRLRGSQLDLRV